MQGQFSSSALPAGSERAQCGTVMEYSRSQTTHVTRCRWEAALARPKICLIPILAPLLSPELANAHGEGNGGAFALGVSAIGALVSSVELGE